MGCEAQLAENVYSHPLFRQAILTSNVGQTGLVFAVCLGFISGLVALEHARLQVSVNIRTHRQTHTERQTAF